jgi:hypothetical protein
VLRAGAQPTPQSHSFRYAIWTDEHAEAPVIDRRIFSAAVAASLATLALTAYSTTPPAINLVSSASNSQISTGSNDPANLRSCPGLPNAGQVTGCGVIETLPNGTHVRMICWTDGNPPAAGRSAKWFWVEDVDGPRPGQQGYVWSDLVTDQVETPECTDEPTAPFLGQRAVTLTQGPVAPRGYRYAVSLAGFPVDSDVTVECYDSLSPDPFYIFELPIDSSGSAFTDDYCYSADGPDHWVDVDGVESNRVAW